MKYEIHSHTKETSQCAKITAEELVKKYKELGYSGIVITNHYSDFTFSLKEMFNKKLRTGHYLAGYREAKKYETEDFSVLLGVELRFFLNGNDYLIYGVTEELMLFLHRYQSSHRYFGSTGWVSGQIDYEAVEEFYWLFACYTYEA
jgi:histidinol phosphatase-like PHP family hydrolase